jgi:hypothetical protein
MHANSRTMRGNAAARRMAAYEGPMRKLAVISVSILVILIAIPVAWYMWNFPTGSYRYRLSIAVESGGKIHSGSSVIDVFSVYEQGVENHKSSRRLVLSAFCRAGSVSVAEFLSRRTVDAEIRTGHSRVPRCDQGEDRLALAAQAVSVIQPLNRERCAQREETAFGNAAGEAARRISAPS